MTDGNSTPLGVVISAGQAHESSFVTEALEAVQIPQNRPGRPRKRPAALSGDKGYSYRKVRRWLHAHKIEPVIPQRSNQVGAKGGCRKFDSAKYRKRNVVERRVGWLKECRRLGTRFEKLAVNFAAMVELGIIQQLLRLAERCGLL